MRRHIAGALLFALAAGWLISSAAADLPEPCAGAADFGCWYHDDTKHDWSAEGGATGFIPEFAAMLHDGTVLMWWATEGCMPGFPYVERVWDPANGTFTDVGSGEVEHAECSGFAPFSSGRILSIGGVCAAAASKQASMFVKSGDWFSKQDMIYARWYPSALRMPDNRMLAVLGRISQTSTTNVPWVEVYDPVADTWTELMCAEHPNPNAWWYPHLFVLPDGRIFHGGPDDLTYTLDLTVNCQWGEDGEWSTPYSTALVAGMGTRPCSVMVRPGVVMKSGGQIGTNPHHGRTIFIDFNEQTPEWRYINGTDEESLMKMRRSRHNLVLLPDGRVVTIGGRLDSGSAAAAAEWINPALIGVPNVDAEWEELAVATFSHRGTTHQMAMLLPDATVMWFGGEAYGPPFPVPPDGDKAEIFYPPYLFWGPRPVIGVAPDTIFYGSQPGLRLALGDHTAYDIKSVSLIGTSAVTHGYDSNQRYVPLSFTPEPNNGLKITAPANANIAPPGWYMLFVVSNDGVPSVAKFVKLQ